MCGRFIQKVTATEVREMYRLPENVGQIEIELRECGHPGERFAACVENRDGVRSIQSIRWGLHGRRQLIVNARAESAARKPTFSSSMGHRRCLVPASAWIEWRERRPGERTAYAIASKDGAALSIAALWEPCRRSNPTGGPRFVILTTDAEGALARIHARRPVLLGAEETERWLCNATNAQDAQAIALLARRPPLRATPIEQARQQSKARNVANPRADAK